MEGSPESDSGRTSEECCRGQSIGRKLADRANVSWTSRDRAGAAVRPGRALTWAAAHLQVSAGDVSDIGLTVVALLLFRSSNPTIPTNAENVCTFKCGNPSLEGLTRKPYFRRSAVNWNGNAQRCSVKTRSTRLCRALRARKIATKRAVIQVSASTTPLWSHTIFRPYWEVV